MLRKCLIFLAFFCIFPFSVQAKTVYSEIDQDILTLFTEVNETKASFTAVLENTTVIKERIQCFADNFSYQRRANFCLNEYRNDLVTVAREFVEGRPEVGIFLKNVAYCPVMYNLCQGQTEMRKIDSQNLCIQFERQCIDLMLDKYWRGTPLYDNIELRVHK